MVKKLLCAVCALALMLSGCQLLTKEESESSQESAALQEESSDFETSEVSNEIAEESSEEESSLPEESSEESSEIAAEPQIDEQIEQMLADMSVEEKVGQMFFARFPGEGSAEYYAQEYHLGGYVLFAVDFEGYSEEGVISKIDSCQEVSKIPMLMGVDEEGGTVTRVSQFFRDVPFASPRDVYTEGGWSAVLSDTTEKCQLLSRLHLNVNLAPVCDLAGDPEDFMYNRSFGDDPELTSDFVGWTISIMNDNQIGAALKHFPGYGNNVDTHTGIAIDEREATTFYEQDFKPFAEGIRAGAGGILVSHNIVNCFDADYPASLSPEVHRILREELGFDGVLMTDDLSMGAILDYCGEVNAAVLAVEAGNDLLISTEFESQYASVLEAVQAGVITEDRIDESVRRILTYKKSIGLI